MKNIRVEGGAQLFSIIRVKLPPTYGAHQGWTSETSLPGSPSPHCPLCLLRALPLLFLLSSPWSSVASSSQPQVQISSPLTSPPWRWVLFQFWGERGVKGPGSVWVTAFSLEELDNREHFLSVINHRC